MKNTFKAVYIVSSARKNPSMIYILFIRFAVLESVFEAIDYWNHFGTREWYLAHICCAFLCRHNNLDKHMH